MSSLAIERPERSPMRMAALFLRLTALAGGAAALGGIIDVRRIGQSPALDTELAEGGGAALLPNLLLGLMFLTGAILFLRWFMTAIRRAQALGAQGMPASPGWAAAGFFLPLFNLVLPFVAMRALWKASERPQDWEAGDVSPLVNVWWAAWIVSGLAGAVGMAAQKAGGEAPLDVMLISEVVSSTMLVPAGLLLAAIIERVELRLTNSERMRRVWS